MVGGCQFLVHADRNTVFTEGRKILGDFIELRKTDLSIRCLPKRAGMMPGRTDLTVVLEPRDIRLSSGPRMDSLGDPRFNSAVALIESGCIRPAEPLDHERLRSQPEEQRPQVLGIAADQGSGQGEHLSATAARAPAAWPWAVSRPFSSWTSSRIR